MSTKHRWLPWGWALAVLFVGCEATGNDASHAQPEAAPAGFAQATEGLRCVPGFVPMWSDSSTGRVLFELAPGDQEFLHWTSLPTGLGSNDVGLDRGQVGRRRLLRVERAGPRVLLVEPNLTWRSSSTEEPVQRAASESFARSVLHGFDVLAEEDGRVLVDASEFLQRDLHLVSRSLASSDQGNYRLDPDRSALLEDSLRGFPDNSMVDVLQTFVSEEPGSEVRSTAPDGGAASLVLRHNFVRLPPPGYRPRAFHPRSGFSPLGWNDLAAEVDEPLRQRFLPRHRLIKLHPERARSEPVAPIVYYIDRGAPEPVRTALLEGARYWEPVFAAAGFPGGFRAELLPEGADLHDARFNVVQWVNRSTRGWSYGNSITDPRSGEIIKGHVTLGALRVRQDVLLAEGLLAPYANGADPRPVEMALARIRQLSAHEIGHTLGLAHNFAASTRSRASVMDYPAPLVTIDAAGELDLSDAYRDGCGAWDELAIRYGYADFEHLDPNADPADLERRGLQGVLDEALAADQPFLTDRDARGADRAHPLANLWDNGSDPVQHLELTMAVRARALAGLNRNALAEGRALAELEEVLVPVFLHHRYQLEAAVRALGGVDYAYARRGEGMPPSRPVAGPTQARALELALETLRPDFLRLPASVLLDLPPRPPGSAGTREQFQRGALLFDRLAPARASIEITLEFLLDPQRCKRLVDQARLQPELPGLEDVLLGLRRSAWGPEGDSTADGDLIQELRHAIARHLMRLAQQESVALRVRQPVLAELRELARSEPSDSLLSGTIERFLLNPAEVTGELRAARVPPGSPIGCEPGPEPR